ncbi:MAG: hypothetical protein AAGJ35_16325, partial [Myxococcota bacterium]
RRSTRFLPVAPLVLQTNLPSSAKSPTYCAPELSFDTLISERTAAILNDPQAALDAGALAGRQRRRLLVFRRGRSFSSFGEVLRDFCK